MATAKLSIKTDQSDKPMTNMTRKATSGNDALHKGKSQIYRGGFEYVINSMFIISLIGMCVKIFFTSPTSANGTYGPANTIIYGYGIVALAILTVMFVSYAIHDRIGRIKNKGNMESIVSFIKAFLTSSMPSVLTIILLLWVVTLNITYYNQINKGMVASEYYQLSNGTSFLFVIQIICLFQYLKLYMKIETDGKNSCDDDKQAQTRISFATYFIAAMNLVVVGMMTIILEFFSTDG